MWLGDVVSSWYILKSVEIPKFTLTLSPKSKPFDNVVIPATLRLPSTTTFPSLEFKWRFPPLVLILVVAPTPIVTSLIYASAYDFPLVPIYAPLSEYQY